MIILEFSLKNSNLNSAISLEDEKKSIISIWGDIGVGKTTLCFAATLSALSKQKKIIYINTKSYFKEDRFNQIMGFYPKFDTYNLLIYNCDTFKKQIETIMNLEFLIKKEIEVMGKSKISLIVLDSASTLFHLTMGDKETNLELQRALNTTLATLDYIRRIYGITILLTNRSTLRFDEKLDKTIEKTSISSTINFFSNTSIKIERTSQIATRSLIIEKHPRNLLKKITIKMTENGFE